MASSTTIDVDDFGDIKEAGMESLNFQDIPHDTPDSPEKGQTTHFTQFPHSAADSDDEADDKEKLIKDDKSGSASFWTFAYYQQFFDVDTAQVGQRIVGSMVPRPGSNYLMHQIRPNPDLYGPFWICTTLVFTTAIAGNLANYFSMAGRTYHWQYDFHKVTLAATAIYSYWWLVPLILWGVLWWRGSQAKFSFLEMLCVYGYSLAIYVPISILWAIQVSWLQWILVLLGAALSGSVLLLTFWPAIKEDSQKIAIGLMIFILIMHAALAAGFVLYFFYVPSSAPPTTAPVTFSPPQPAPVNKTLSRGGAKANPPVKQPSIVNNVVPGKSLPQTVQNRDVLSQPEAPQSQNKAGMGPSGQSNLSPVQTSQSEQSGVQQNQLQQGQNKGGNIMPLGIQQNQQQQWVDQRSNRLSSGIQQHQQQQGSIQGNVLPSGTQQHQQQQGSIQGNVLPSGTQQHQQQQGSIQGNVLPSGTQQNQQGAVQAPSWPQQNQKLQGVAQGNVESSGPQLNQQQQLVKNQKQSSINGIQSKVTQNVNVRKRNSRNSRARRRIGI